MSLWLSMDMNVIRMTVMGSEKRVLALCVKVSQCITEYYRVLQSITEYYRVLQSVNEYYRVLQSIAEYSRVL